MPWFAQGVDAANGTLSMHHAFLSGEPCLQLDWDIGRSKAVIDAIVAMHLQLSAATNGHPVVPPTWSVLHSLGDAASSRCGCGMADTLLNGVVDHAGEVFNYKNLVCDRWGDRAGGAWGESIAYDRSAGGAGGEPALRGGAVGWAFSTTAEEMTRRQGVSAAAEGVSESSGSDGGGFG